ncbi:MAG: hypothetical protein ABI559_04425 [Chloroflexota bacterium]
MINIRRLFALTIVVAGLSLALAACGGDSTSDATASPTVSPSPSPTLAAADLNALLLPVQQVVVDGTTLAYSAADSKAVTRADILDGSFDPTRDAGELDQYGFQGGQRQIFAKANDDGTGVFFVGATLDLTDSTEHASQVPDAQAADFESDVGKAATDASGTEIKFDSSTPYVPTGIAGAHGYLQQVEFNGTKVYFTNIAFARGPLVLLVSTAAYDAKDHKADTEALAQQLDAHVSTKVKS